MPQEYHLTFKEKYFLSTIIQSNLIQKMLILVNILGINFSPISQ